MRLTEVFETMDDHPHERSRSREQALKDPTRHIHTKGSHVVTPASGILDELQELEKKFQEFDIEKASPGEKKKMAIAAHSILKKITKG